MKLATVRFMNELNLRKDDLRPVHTPANANYQIQPAYECIDKRSFEFRESTETVQKQIKRIQKAEIERFGL